jgi:FtsP/CotA-like multicopper oxidase with cupredoxin domain
VVAADGQNVKPVTVDEFQIGVAETFDVIVTPQDRAYSFVSESIDRSGLGRATLAPRAGMSAPVPPLRPRPLLTMKDMGMGSHAATTNGPEGPDTRNIAAIRGVDPSAEQNASRNLWKLTGWKEPTDHGTIKAAATAATAMAGIDHGSMPGMAGMDPSQMAGMAGMSGMDHSAMGHGATQTAAAGTTMPGMDHGSMAGMNGMDHGSMATMNMRDPSNAPEVQMGPGVQTISPMPTDRTGEPPQGLEGLDHRVLVYRDLEALERNPDLRAPSRSLDIHLTGNMERYMWSFDGVKMSEPAEPIPFRLNERVRVTLINDTMMPHPIHLHGHFFELVTGHGAYAPRKHTVNVPPGGKMTWDLTADAAGDWAFHCHNLFHMTAGMMRVVTIRPLTGEPQNAAS